MTDRIFNFSAGPASLPTSVLEKARAELLDYQGSGMSIMEMSHRGPHFDKVLEAAESRLRKIMQLPEDYSVLFLQGGASLQFAMAPLNFGSKDRPIDIVHTGYWTLKAIHEIEKIAECRIIASGEKDEFRKLPAIETSMIHDQASYLHYCSNNTIYGTQWKKFIHKKNVPSLVDMSSDFLSRQMDFSQFDMIYAGAQKNIGPAGLVVVVIKNEFAELGRRDLPLILQYRAHIEAGSRYHTPPTFSIYIAGLVLEWIEEQGGLEKIEAVNNQKAGLLYECIDSSDFYSCPVETQSRSTMNVVFRIDSGNEALEKKFIDEAEQNGMSGLKAHRHTGGVRASIYNAMPLAGVQKLVHFMKTFEKNI